MGKLRLGAYEGLAFRVEGFPEPRPQVSTPEEVAALCIKKFFAQLRPGLLEAPEGGSWEFGVNSNLASRVPPGRPFPSGPLRAYIPVFIFIFKFFLFFTFLLRGMWDLSSPTRDRTRTPCSGSAES